MSLELSMIAEAMLISVILAARLLVDILKEVQAMTATAVTLGNVDDYE